MVSKRAIVTGCNGQDGFYMCKLLWDKSYNVWQVGRDYINSIDEIIKTFQPDEIYNFAGVSDVINPFYNVQQIFEVNVGIPIKILDSIIHYSPKTKFFQASSCLSLKPIYPYGVSKRSADELIKQYRDKFNIYACSGIFSSHESPRRKDHFFSKRIVNAAINKEKITVGNLSGYRDYGYAPDYMEAAHLMLQQYRPKDYQIGTGQLINLKTFVDKVFKEAGLDYKDYITEDIKQQRPEIPMCADVLPIKEDLGWTPKHSIDDLIKIMLNERTV